MFISLAPPPLPILEGIRGAGELCSRDGVAELCQRQGLGCHTILLPMLFTATGSTGEKHISSISGLGQIDPISAVVSSVVGSGASIFKTIEDTKTAKNAISLETAQLKAANTEAARTFAMQQAEAAKAPAESKLLDQKLALIAIGSVALIVAGVFLISTVRKG